MENLSFEEEQELENIRSSQKRKGLNDLNNKNLSAEDLDEIFCEI